MTKPTAPPLGEFERIARFFAPLAGPGALNLTDDVALIDGPAGEQYALTTDTIVESVDYFPDDPPFQVAQKLLRVNLSDIAAKGATPFGYLLTTALPQSHGDAWLEQFTQGLAADQKEFGVMLLGGDSSGTPGPTSLTLALIGKVATGRAVLRSTAQAGDTIYVSGTLGDSALGLAVRKGEIGPELGEAERDYLVDRYRLPRPRVALGPRLGGIAHAMIDISDGLLSDLGHICAASRLRGIVQQPSLPFSPAARTAIAANPGLNIAVTGGGDDYELLFTAPAAAAEAIAQISAAVGVPVTAIGAMEKGEGFVLLDAAGQVVKVERKGYAHFS
ncbi:MAG TPA: thiamine-phosphate kinase [Stellaceae bacterium]|jgi:thiamine-monophosphate kinase|nr:thiamine-phosphate kinase [Stellaceae bacterium]